MAGKVKLSILICHLEEREKQIDKLLDMITPQPSTVEIIINGDNGELSIGAKRNNLLSRAVGDYVCFIDDDDIVADFYVEKILKAIESKPDCVGFNGLIVHPLTAGRDQREEPVTYRIFNEGINRKANLIACGIGHLNPIKREIAMSIQYPDKDKGEDYEYAKALKGKLATEEYINLTMYYYLQGNKDG